MTIQQKQTIEQIKRYVLSEIGMASICGIVKEVFDYESLKHFDKTKKGVKYIIYTFDRTGQTAYRYKWADVEVGAKGGVYGKYDRMDELEKVKVDPYKVLKLELEAK